MTSSKQLGSGLCNFQMTADGGSGPIFCNEPAGHRGDHKHTFPAVLCGTDHDVSLSYPAAEQSEVSLGTCDVLSMPHAVGYHPGECVNRKDWKPEREQSEVSADMELCEEHGYVAKAICPECKAQGGGSQPRR